MSLVEARELTFSYRGSAQTVVKNLSLKIERGEFLSIQGPSGSGKSTLLYLLAGFLRPSGGHIFFDGQDLNSLDQEDTAIFRNRHMGFIFQQFHLMARKTVLENVLLSDLYPVEMERGAGEAHREEAILLLQRLGLGDKMNVSPNQLSGGQQQRVAIARALLHRPQVLFADEPTGNLDSKTGAEIFKILEELAGEGITVVLITHDEHLAQKTGRRIEMRDGEIVADERKRPIVRKERDEKPKAWSLSPPMRQMWKLTKIAWGELQRNRSRSILTLLGILFGVAAVSSMISLGDFTKRNMIRSYQEMGVNTFGVNGYENWMTDAKAKSAVFQGFQSHGDIDTLFRVFPDLNSWTPLFGSNTAGGIQVIYGGKYLDGASLTGMNEDGLRLMRLSLASGRNFHALQVDEARSVCLIGSDIRRQLFEHRSPLNEWITIRLDERYFSCQVIGALKPIETAGSEAAYKNKQVYVPAPFFVMQATFWYNAALHSFLLESKPGVDIEKISKGVVKFFKNKYGDSGEFYESTNAAMISQMRKFLTLFTILLLFVATLSLVVGCIGVSNMMTVSVSERLSEFGLRKALGATDGSLRLQILYESSILCLFAGAAGVLTGFIFQQMAIYAASKLFPKLQYSWEFNFWAIAIAMAATFLAGYISGLSAAEKVERLSVAEVLRSE